MANFIKQNLIVFKSYIYKILRTPNLSLFFSSFVVVEFLVLSKLGGGSIICYTWINSVSYYVRVFARLESHEGPH